MTIPTATLAMFLVHPAVPRRIYIERLRALISAAVEIAQTTDFDRDEVVTLDPLPEWFRKTPDVPSIEAMLVTPLSDIATGKSGIFRSQSGDWPATWEGTSSASISTPVSSS
ncbi:hypothetical protein ACWF82_08340 [Nocardia sp. NPDC055053]